MESNLVIIEEPSDEEDFDIGPLCTVVDETVKDKARLTLPNILTTALTSDGNMVFAKFPISYRTQFGPLDAPLVSGFALPALQFPLKSKVKDDNHAQLPNAPHYLYYDTFNEKSCNWMCLVRPARNFEEQNLVAHFVREKVYFTTSRAVEEGEELKVWYAPKYASFMGKNIWTPAIRESEPYETLSVRVHQVHKTTKSSSYCEGDHGLDVRKVPPKKRGWKRASQQINKSNAKPDELHMPPHEIEQNVGQLSSTNISTPIHTLPTSILQPIPEPIPTHQNKTFGCPECGKLFSKKFTLKMHLTTHSKTFDFLCQDCGKGFKRRDKLQDHIKRVHSLYKKSRKSRSPNSRFVPRLPPKDIEKFLYKCIRCSVGFVRRGMLINHMHKQHPEMDVNTIPELSIPIFKDNMQFSCLYCNKSYKSNSKRKKHIQKHHPGQSVPPDCRKSKNSAEKSGISSKGMIAVKPVPCPYCPSQYTSRSKLVKHVQAKHPKIHETKKSLGTNSNSWKQLSQTEDTFPPKDVQVITDSINDSNPTEKVAENSLDYNNVENLITFWNATDDSTIPNHSISNISASQSVGDYMHSHNPDSSHLVEASRSQVYSQSNFVTSQADFQFIEEAGSMQDNRKLSTAEELKSYHHSSQPRDFAHHATISFNNTIPTQDMDKPTNSQNNHNVHKDQFEKRQNFQKSARQLPLTYSRGRKQLLIPFCNDRLGNQYTPPAVEKHGNNYNVTVVNNPTLPSTIMNNSQYQLPSDPKQRSSSQSETSIPPLTYQDVNWM